MFIKTLAVTRNEDSKFVKMYNQNKKVMEGRNSLHSPDSYSKKRLVDRYYQFNQNISQNSKNLEIEENSMIFENKDQFQAFD